MHIVVYEHTHTHSSKWILYTPPAPYNPTYPNSCPMDLTKQEPVDNFKKTTSNSRRAVEVGWADGALLPGTPTGAEKKTL